MVAWLLDLFMAETNRINLGRNGIHSESQSHFNHLLSAEQLTPKLLEERIFPLSDILEADIGSGPRYRILHYLAEDDTVLTFSEEPTTRSGLSMHRAAELYKEEATTLTRSITDSFDRPVEPFENIDQVLLFERLDHLSEDHNMRLDRMTMAHGVEARVPFEDHRLVEFTLQIPVRNLFGASAKEWLGQAAKPWVPPEITNRPKVHFPSLPDQWLSGEGAEWAAEVLLDHGACTRAWIKPDALEGYINEHKNQEHSHGRLLWGLMVLELWLQNLPNWRKIKAYA